MTQNECCEEFLLGIDDINYGTRVSTPLLTMGDREACSLRIIIIVVVVSVELPFRSIWYLGNLEFETTDRQKATRCH